MAFQSKREHLNSQSIPVLDLSYYCKYENQKTQVENDTYKVIILFSLIQHNFLIPESFWLPNPKGKVRQNC